MRLLLVACLVALLAGCGSSRSQSAQARPQAGVVSISTTRAGTFSLHVERDLRVAVDTLPAGAERGWSALKTVYSDMEIPLTTVNEEARVVGGVSVRAPERIAGERLERWVRCGSGLTGDLTRQRDVVLTLLSEVEAEGPDRSVLYTHLDARAVSRATADPDVSCATRGRLEEEIAKTLTLKLLQGGT